MFFKRKGRSSASRVSYAGAMHVLIAAAVAAALMGSSVTAAPLSAMGDKASQETPRAFEMPFDLVDERWFAC